MITGEMLDEAAESVLYIYKLVGREEDAESQIGQKLTDAIDAMRIDAQKVDDILTPTIGAMDAGGLSQKAATVLFAFLLGVIAARKEQEG